MKRGYSLIWTISAIAAASCTANSIDVRSIKQPLAQGSQPANFRVAEGASQLALGNVGLAVEAFRKALREEPDSVPALIGLATCYDRMGRGDLSRRYYESALAVDPANTEVYSLFAQSLDSQGQRDEAARVKTELAARVVAPEAPRDVPGSVPVLPPPPAQSVTVALAPPRSAPVAVERPSFAPVAVAPHIAPLAVERPIASLKLERLSLREVALVTRPEPKWEARTVARTATRTTIQFDRKMQPAVTLLNAARVQGLAARTRAYLAMRGFADAKIGDAPAVRKQSAILYSSADAPRALRLAAQFGFSLERREADKGGLTILLGRDAARETALQPKA
ncbi:LytR C-terminal domain-containing protein [Sphingomonas sp. RB56-2]|uniref:LytR C-terminal domain-containing protein n=1 Tax=Sphingomonas brevis TaxID=2908206 RepID=A0ABT0SBB4_9SPHN|nr:LytR C-terminal domain-containing protein [Sphingomonas brevis]MCL6741404.1 LytR C-terminal domain-containing protein [Sphingomonas brevis]